MDLIDGRAISIVVGWCHIAIDMGGKFFPIMTLIFRARVYFLRLFRPHNDFKSSLYNIFGYLTSCIFKNFILTMRTTNLPEQDYLTTSWYKRCETCFKMWWQFCEENQISPSESSIYSTLLYLTKVYQNLKTQSETFDTQKEKMMPQDTNFRKLMFSSRRGAYLTQVVRNIPIRRSYV